MSKRILRGTDIHVSWRVNVYQADGTRVDVASMSLGVQLIVADEVFELERSNSGLSISGDTITFTFYGRDQVRTGAYILKLYDTENSSFTYYTCNAFVIVNSDGQDTSTPETIELESSIAVARVIVSRGQKGDKGDKGDNGAAGTIGSTLEIGPNGNWWIDGVDTGIPATGAAGASGAFKSIVFKRSTQTTINTPVGGTYEDPIPHDPDTNERWSDGIPGGEGMVYASSAWFYSNGEHSAWSTPQIMRDTADWDIEFAYTQNNDAKPAEPNDNNRHKEASPYGYDGQVWFDPELDEYTDPGVLRDFTKCVWMAQRYKKNGENASWTILRIQGEKGDAGQARFKSTIFVRMNSTPTKPGDSDGSYNNPSPHVLAGQNSLGHNVYWEDGIPGPDGDTYNTVWACSRTFTIDGKAPQDPHWSDPKEMTDSETFDVEFAFLQDNDAEPDFPNANNRHKEASPYGYAGQVWFDPVLDYYSAAGERRDFKPAYWRAEREIINGEEQGWIITRIKGEKGERGDGDSSYKSTMFVRMNPTASQSIPTKPSADKGSFSDPSPSGCLAGRNTLPDGSPGAYVYWTDGIPEGSNKLWATTRIFTTSGNAPQQEYWTDPREMTDTADWDVEFAKMQPNDAAPAIPTTENRHGGSGTQVWFDPVLDSSEDFTKMFWRAEQSTKNGVKQDWIITRIQGERGDKGERSAVAYLYKRSTTKPTAPRNDSGWGENVYVNYTFATGAMEGRQSSGSSYTTVNIPSGWVTFGDIPDGTETIWAIAATATAESSDPDDGLFKSDWSDPTELGAGGKDGLNCLTLTLYKRATSTPQAFGRDTVFDFAENTLTYDTYVLESGPQDPDVTIDGWRRYIPSGTDQVWQTQATALSAGGATDTIEEEEWTPPARVGGSDGISSTVVYLYRRSSTTLTSADKPSGDCTYSFEENRILEDMSPWSKTVPDGGDQIWISGATASASGSSRNATIQGNSTTNQWSDPVPWGTNNFNNATIKLYRRSSTTLTASDKPNAKITYRFSNGDIIVGSTTYDKSSTTAFAGGWSRSDPGNSSSYPLWTTQATAISITDTDDIETSEWSTPVKEVQDGGQGEKGDRGTGILDVVYWYKVSANSSGVTPPSISVSPDTSAGGNWVNGATTTIPSPDENSPYLWCFVRWRYTNNGTTASETKQGNAYIVRSFNSSTNLNYQEIYEELKGYIDDDFAPGTLTARVGTLENNAANYVTGSTFESARSTLEAGINNNKAAITNSVSKGTLHWESPTYKAYRVKSLGNTNVTGNETLRIGDVVVIYGTISSTQISSGYIYRWNDSSSWNGASVPSYTPILYGTTAYTQLTGSTLSSPYNTLKARNVGSGTKYVKGVILSKPEIVVDKNTPSNGYITFEFGDIIDYNAFVTTAGSEDFATYESRIIGYGYHLSSYIEEMSAIRQQSDNILLAVGNGQSVSAAIHILKDADTNNGKIVLDATNVEVTGNLSASIVQSQEAYIGSLVAGDVTAQELNTGTSSGMNIHIENGMLDIMNGTTKRAAFGLNSSGDVILSFYDANGNEIYNLGPSGWNHV